MLYLGQNRFGADGLAHFAAAVSTSLPASTAASPTGRSPPNRRDRSRAPRVSRGGAPRGRLLDLVFLSLDGNTFKGDQRALDGFFERLLPSALPALEELSLVDVTIRVHSPSTPDVESCAGDGCRRWAHAALDAAQKRGALPSLKVVRLKSEAAEQQKERRRSSLG